MKISNKCSLAQAKINNWYKTLEVKIFTQHVKAWNLALKSLCCDLLQRTSAWIHSTALDSSGDRVTDTHSLQLVYKVFFFPFIPGCNFCKAKLTAAVILCKGPSDNIFKTVSQVYNLYIVKRCIFSEVLLDRIVCVYLFSFDIYSI